MSDETGTRILLTREHAAMRTIALSFFGLAAFVAVEAARSAFDGVEAAVREGVEAWRGDACCTPASILVGGDGAGCEDDCCAD